MKPMLERRKPEQRGAVAFLRTLGCSMEKAGSQLKPVCIQGYIWKCSNTPGEFLRPSGPLSLQVPGGLAQSSHEPLYQVREA